MEARTGVVIKVGVYCEGNLVYVGGKRKLRRMFWKVRAEIRKQLLLKKKKQQMQHKSFSFHYDPFSYALNFDNGNFGFFC